MTTRKTPADTAAEDGYADAVTGRGLGLNVHHDRAKAEAYRRGYQAGLERITENAAGVHGRGPQEDAKRRAEPALSATLYAAADLHGKLSEMSREKLRELGDLARDLERRPTDTERKLGRAVLQAQAALESIDRNMAALANQVTIHVDDPLRSVPGTQRLAGNLALELRELLLELGMGVDTDGDPDPFAQVNR